MLTPIQFHDQARFRAAEIGDETTDGMLAAKFCANQPSVAEVRPQLALRFRLIMTQSAGAVSRSRIWWLADEISPSPCPLPQGGRGSLKHGPPWERGNHEAWHPTEFLCQLTYRTGHWRSLRRGYHWASLPIRCPCPRYLSQLSFRAGQPEGHLQGAVQINGRG
jgi:hypothetical protein